MCVRTALHHTVRHSFTPLQGWEAMHMHTQRSLWDARAAWMCVCVWAASCQNVLICLTADPNQGKGRKRARDRGNRSERNAKRAAMNRRGGKARWAEKGGCPFFFFFHLSSSRRAGLTGEPRCRGLRTLDATRTSWVTIETPLDRIHSWTNWFWWWFQHLQQKTIWSQKMFFTTLQTVYRLSPQHSHRFGGGAQCLPGDANPALLSELRRPPSTCHILIRARWGRWKVPSYADKIGLASVSWSLWFWMKFIWTACCHRT